MNRKRPRDGGHFRQHGSSARRLPTCARQPTLRALTRHALTDLRDARQVGDTDLRRRAERRMNALLDQLTKDLPDHPGTRANRTLAPKPALTDGESGTKLGI